MYDAIGYMEKPLVKLTKDDLFESRARMPRDGVDFMTIHCGINKSVTKTFKGDRPPDEHREPRRLTAVWLDGGHR